ncbi:hypothetical protein DFH29DRAFT_818935 [Suillus ampliporus]|nr:hypothetical protein DFH29DRAFT_818935 [Suillus ampliporus]
MGEILFDPTTTITSNVTEGFRIFTNPAHISLTPAYRLQAVRGLNIIQDKLTIYTDGSCINNGKMDARCGSGIWITEDHLNNRAIKIPGKRQSNQITKIAAILIALQQTAPYIPITFVTDSRYAIEGLTKNLPEWENKDG